MQSTLIKCVGIALLVLSRSAYARETLTIEIPTGKTGDIQVAEVLSRLARASGVNLKIPAAGLTLSTQGLAGPLTRTLLSEALGPEVSIKFRPGVMVIAIDDHILAPDRRGVAGPAAQPRRSCDRRCTQKAGLRNVCTQVISSQ